MCEMREKMTLNYTNNFRDLIAWHRIVYPILNSPEYRKRKCFRHHGDISVYDHCVHVSIKAFMFAKKFGLNSSDAAIAGLLHDFYETPWQDVKIKQPLLKKHGFTHAESALNNSRIYFKEHLNPTIENAIYCHMFPLNKRIPKNKISILITIVDKYVSLEMLKEPESIRKTIGALKGD